MIAYIFGGKYRKVKARESWSSKTSLLENHFLCQTKYLYIQPHKLQEYVNYFAEYFYQRMLEGSRVPLASQVKVLKR